MKKSLLFSVSLIGTIGFSTALPLATFALFGRWLDRRFETGRDFFYAGLLIATLIVYLSVKQIVTDAIRNFEKLCK